jgi:AcrR family transcriptional regulator
LDGTARRPEDSPTNRRRGALDADAWIDAALAELASHGVDGVRVEVLAKRLGVTKGSFYWHFKDRDALLAMTLERWRRRATLALIEHSDRGTPAERLRQILEAPFRGRRAAQAASVELAVRLWGRGDPRARATLEEVDELRLSHIAQVFVDAGVLEENEARARAVLAYAYQQAGAPLVQGEGGEALMRQIEALLVPSEV